MINNIIKVILLVSLIKSMKTHKSVRETLSKELDYSDESRHNENLIDDDPRSGEDQKTEYLGHIKLLGPKSRTIGKNDKQKDRNTTSSEIRLKITESRNKSDNFENSESDQDEQSSPEHSGQDTDFIDDRPSLDEKTSKLNKNDLPQITDKLAEPLNSNSDVIDNRPVKIKTENSAHDTDFINTRPILDEDIAQHTNDDRPPSERKTENKSNLNKTKGTNAKQKKSERLNVKQQDKVIHLDQMMVSDHDFAYMAAVLKGSKYVCAGALIDESWVLTAANGIHLMIETIKFFRIRLGSINFKKGGMLLPIKYYEIHPYFNSSKPDYDLALLMLAKPVRYTVNIRSIRLQLVPKDITATHFIKTAWHTIVKPGLNKSSVEVIKHHRILSVAHLHPTEPEDCLEELKEIGDIHGVMCLEDGAENTCVRDTGAPVVFNGVLWAVISSWKPQECDDVSTFATLVSDRNVSTWLHATIHEHKWHPE